MARPSTIARVHEAALSLVVERGAGALTMEGIAARAGVGKQTLYRTWSSTHAILFDALLARSTTDGGEIAVTDTGDLHHDLEELLREAIREMTTQPTEALLRGIAAQIQLDQAMAEEFQDRLLDPQLQAVRARLDRGGIADPTAAAELLLAPVFYRWFMRTHPMPERWVIDHVHRVLAGAKLLP